MPLRRKRGGGGGGAGLSLVEIGTITPNFGSVTNGQYAGDTAPGNGITLPTRVRTAEIWAIQLGGGAGGDDNIRLFFAAHVPDTSEASGGTANDTNGAAIDVEGGTLYLTWGQGDTLLVARSAAITTGEITLYRVDPGNDDFARALSASLGADNVLSLGLTRDGAGPLSVTADLSRLQGWRGAWASGTEYRAGDLVSHGGFYYLVRAAVASASDEPATDPTNYAPLDNYAGNWSAGNYQSGTIAAHAGRWWIASSEVVTGDPAPNAVANVKWLPAGLTTVELALLGQTPLAWSVGAYSTGDQAFWARRLYRCIAARTSTDTDNPATDTTGWAPVGTGSADGVVTSGTAALDASYSLAVTLQRSEGAPVEFQADLSALVSSGLLFTPTLLTNQTYDLGTGVLPFAIYTGTSGTDPLVCPEAGFLLIEVHGFQSFEGNVTWREAVDLRASTMDDPLHLRPTGVTIASVADIYTDDQNRVFMNFGVQQAEPGRVSIWHVLASPGTAGGAASSGVSYLRAAGNQNHGVRVRRADADFSWLLTTSAAAEATHGFVDIPGTGTDNSLRVTLPHEFTNVDGTTSGNDFDLVFQRGAAAHTAAAIAAHANIQLSGQGEGITVTFHQAGVVGNDFTFTVNDRAEDTPAEFSYSSATAGELRVSRSYPISSVIAAINGARHNGNQLITATRWNSQPGDAVDWATQGDHDLSGGRAAQTTGREPLAIEYNDVEEIRITLIATDTLAEIQTLLENFHVHGSEPFDGNVALTGDGTAAVAASLIGANEGDDVNLDFGGAVDAGGIVITVNETGKTINIAYATTHTVRDMVRASNDDLSIGRVAGTNELDTFETAGVSRAFDFDELGAGTSTGGMADGVVNGVDVSLSGTVVTTTLRRTIGADLSDTVDLATLEEWRGEWSNLAGQTLRVGDLVEHTSRYYIVRVEHQRINSGPDTDSTNFALLNNWGGAYSATGFYHAGSLVVYDSGIWVNNADVLDTDPDPDAAANTKWLYLTRFSAADKIKLDAQPAAWAAGSFSTGDQRSYLGTIYERIADGADTAGQNPVTNTDDWRPLGAHASLPVASETQAGISELADATEAAALSDTTKPLTPGRVPRASESQTGVIQIADNTQTDDATNNTHATTPNKVRRITGAAITPAERTAASPATTVRTYTPADIVAMIRTHEIEGVTTADVNARVMALVEAWALQANANTLVPAAKIDAGITRDTELVAAIANFQTVAQINILIANALAATGYVTDGGPWTDRDFVADVIVRHDGATYLSNVAVPMGSSATTEPGVGGQWETYWDRLGYEDGPPNALIGVTRTDRTLTFNRESGDNPLEVTLPAGAESAYSYYQEFSDLSTPAFNLATTAPPAIELDEITNDPNDPASGGTGAWPDHTQTIIDAMLPAGLDLSKPIVTDYHGYILLEVNNNRLTEVSFGYRLFAGTDNQITFWRNWRGETTRNIEYPISLDFFSTTGTLAPGMYPADSGSLIDLNQSLFDVPVHVQIIVRIQIYSRAAGYFTQRQDADINRLLMSQGAVTIYQLGAFEQTGTGSSRGLKLFTSNTIPTSRGTHGNAITELRWTRNEAPAGWTVEDSIVRPPDLPHDESVTGIWVVSEDITDSANPVEVGSAKLPWGNADFGADTIRLADNEYVGILSRTNMTTGRVEYQIRWNNPDSEDTGEDNRRIILYESVAGEKGDAGDDGSTNFEPDDLGEHTFNLAGTAAEIALTDASNTAIICPDNGYIIATMDVPGLGLTGAIQWMLAEDLRDAASDEALTAGFYTSASNQIFFHAGMQSGPINGNTILIQHVGDTEDDTSGAESTVLPSIAQFEVTGDLFPAPGSIGGDSYTYHLAISQSGHASAARIVGFAGTETNPSSVAVLRNVATLHSEQGTVSIPAGVMLAAAGDIYTIRLEVYGRGVAVTEEPTAYHDARITAREAATASVHFGHIPATSGATDITDFTDDISTGGSAFADWTVAGIVAGDGDRRLYWLVPRSLPQPGRYEADGFNISSSVEAAVQVTIASIDYNAYLTEADGPYDSTSNGYTVTISDS